MPTFLGDLIRYQTSYYIVAFRNCKCIGAATREIADEVLDLSGLRSGLSDEPFQRQSVLPRL